MTPKEAIEKLTVLKRFMNPISRNDVAIDTAISALEKADKYAWHDLRKDPNDLPEIDPDFSPTSKRVYFSTKDDAYTGQYDHQWKTWDSDGYEGLAISEVVIAWREIEPFEIEPFGEVQI